MRNVLAAVPYSSITAYAKVAGVDREVISTLHTRDTIRRRVAEAILAVTPDAVAALTDEVPAQPAIDAVRKMQAAGWSLRWQMRKLRADLSWLWHPDRPIRRATLDAVTALARTVGERAATPENSGLTKNAIRLAIANARALGYYPAAAYDEDGTLHPEYLQDEEPTTDYRRMTPEAKASARFAILTEMIRSGTSRVQAVKPYGIGVNAVDRWLQRGHRNPNAIGLRFQALAGNQQGRIEVAPGYGGLANIVLKYATWVATDSDTDPVQAWTDMIAEAAAWHEQRAQKAAVRAQRSTTRTESLTPKGVAA
ncbi:MAG TPA: hypothetical protein VFP72_07360 [Kineosporiaceae bacterium]|nr:hypothetical protein [Kineosporiaceae bacterium]